MPHTPPAAASLTRDAVIDAAAALVAEQGYAALSMRALGERCGVSAMTLYRHVQTKEDLLGALADRILGEISLPEPGSAPWQEIVAGVFGAMHRILVAHPELAEIGARQHLVGERFYAAAEVVLGALERAGLTGPPAASAFAALTSFTLGFTQRQVWSRSEETLPDRMAGLERLPHERHPHLLALGDTFLMRYADSDFDAGLSLLIAGLEQHASAARGHVDSEPA